MQLLTVLLLTLVALGGAVGGLSMLAYPNGSGLGLSTRPLRHTPVDTYRLPGVFLLLVMTMWPIANIVGIVLDEPWVGPSVFALGVVTMVWIVYEYITVRVYSPLQPFTFTVGLLLAGTGLLI